MLNIEYRFKLAALAPIKADIFFTASLAEKKLKRKAG